MIRIRACVVAGAILLAPGCGDRPAGPAPSVDGPTQATLPPAEVGRIFAVTLRQVLDQVDEAADRIDALDPRNPIRRTTLSLRIRAAEVCLQADRRQNRMMGVLELWFWVAAMERAVAVGDSFGAGQPVAASMAAAVQAQVSDLARRGLGTQRWGMFRRQIDEALDAGVRWQANDPAHEAIVARLFEQSRLEAVLAIPLSPFSALAGVGKGGDALADLAVVGGQAVSLAERYPELLSWNLRSMLLDLEDHDGVADVRRQIDRVAAVAETLARTADAMPTRLREETETLLERSRVPQEDLRATLLRAEAAARELRALADGVQGIMALGRDMAASASAAERSPGRPFDVREYGSALAQAATTAAELRLLISEAKTLVAAPDATAATALGVGLGAASAEARAVVDHAALRLAQVLAATLAGILVVGLILRRRA
ncbi:MAG: hypothetical protein RLZZ127_2624 [Planctomycetota bacterium]|jgi:hypothetical protein